MERGEGERLHAQRRKRFWTTIGALAAIGAVTGFIAGFASGRAEVRGAEIDPALLTAGAIGVVLFGLAAVYGSWRFFVTVDEVEVTDNLWASLIGFYVFGFLQPTWWLLSKLDRAPDPNAWVIYAAAMVAATAAYGWRKWQSR